MIASQPDGRQSVHNLVFEILKMVLLAQAFCGSGAFASIMRGSCYIKSFSDPAIFCAELFAYDTAASVDESLVHRSIQYG